MWWWLLFHLHSILITLLLTLFGYLLPALCSAKAVLSNSNDDIQEWLTYWIVLICYLTAESFFSIIFLDVQFFFYYELKLLIICWLTFPQTQGAYLISRKLILPFFHKYEQKIDENITTITSNLTVFAFKHLQKVLWTLLFGGNDFRAFFAHVPSQAPSPSMAAAILGSSSAVQAFLGSSYSVTAIQSFLSPFGIPIPNIVTEIDTPKNQSQVNLFLSSLKNSRLMLDINDSPGSGDSAAFLTCHCRLLGKFYLELTFLGTSLSSAPERYQMLDVLCHKTSASSSVKILSILDIHSVQTVDLDDLAEEGEGDDDGEWDPAGNIASSRPVSTRSIKSVRLATPPPLSSISITFITNDHHEQLLYLKLSPLSELSVENPSPALEMETLASLSNCFQILSSRSRGLVWKKLQLLFLLLRRSLLLTAWLKWTAAATESTQRVPDYDEEL
jgi:uncharacterized membrane protein YccF (DUF307 family)